MWKYLVKQGPGTRMDAAAAANAAEETSMAARQQALQKDRDGPPPSMFSPATRHQQEDDRAQQRAAGGDLPPLQSPPRKNAAAAPAQKSPAKGRRAVQSSAGRVSQTLLHSVAAAMELVSPDAAAQEAPPRAAQRRSSVPAAAAAAPVAEQDSEEGSERGSGALAQLRCKGSKSAQNTVHFIDRHRQLFPADYESRRHLHPREWEVSVAQEGHHNKPWRPAPVEEFPIVVPRAPAEAALAGAVAVEKVLSAMCDKAEEMQASGATPEDIARSLKARGEELNPQLSGLRFSKFTMMETTRSLPLPRSSVEAMVAGLAKRPEVVVAVASLEHGGAACQTAHGQGFIVSLQRYNTCFLAAAMLEDSNAHEQGLWPHGLSTPGGCQHLQNAALSVVAILAAILYALKCFVAYSAAGSWSRTNLQLVRRALGVWAVGLPSQLLLRIMDLAVVLGDVCFTDKADCDDGCHLAVYCAAHTIFCERLRAELEGSRGCMETALAMLGANATSQAGGSAGSGDFAAGMKAANRDTSDPLEVQRAKGEASAAARGQSSVRKFMPDIHAWFMENWRDEKKRGKWEAVVAALPQLKDANEDSLRTVYGRWKREQEKKEKEEKKEQ